MKTKFFITPLAWLALFATCHAQTNDIASIVRQAQGRSSLVKAAQSIVEARRSTLVAAKSNHSPILELSPGLGFTNGNTVLSQEFDLFGRRRSASNLAKAHLKLAEIGVIRAQSEVAKEVLAVIARLLAANEELVSCRVAEASATALFTAVAKQHELGEAPKVHVTRAEVEVLRTRQQVMLAEGRVQTASTSLRSLLGEQASFEKLSWPLAGGKAGAPEARSFELIEARINVDMFDAQAQVTRSEFDPSFSAGIATDAWSLDRSAVRSENFGLQLSFRVPLFDFGQKRGALGASRSEASAARARVTEAQRMADLSLKNARTEFGVADAIVKSYSGDVLPKGEAMLIAMREGYLSGLVTLIEVLEAQQTLTKLRQERIQSVLILRLAEVELWRAQLALPGAEVPR